MRNKSKASFLDLVQGEEINNEGKIDLTRLQNLLFTFILVGSYIAALAEMFRGNTSFLEFPEFDSGAIYMLTISHAGYLAAKNTSKPKK
jgi:hypothetical protein